MWAQSSSHISMEVTWRLGLGILMFKKGGHIPLILILSSNWVTPGPGWWEAGVWAVKTEGVSASTYPGLIGSTVKSIKTEDGNWFTPSEFVVAGGYKKASHWKKTLRCGGKTLQVLMEVFLWWAGGVTSLVVVKHKVTDWLPNIYWVTCRTMRPLTLCFPRGGLPDTSTSVQDNTPICQRALSLWGSSGACRRERLHSDTGAGRQLHALRERRQSLVQQMGRI